MKLKDLATKVFGENFDVGIKEIGIWEWDEKGHIKPIEPDYADEILETHGELEVGAWKLVHADLLVVQFKED